MVPLRGTIVSGMHCHVFRSQCRSVTGPATLVLVTESYPFPMAAEGSFIAPELPLLLECFDRVILAPTIVRGMPDRLPPGVEVDESLAVLGGEGSAFRRGCKVGLEFVRELYFSFWPWIHPRATLRALRHACLRVRTEQWAGRLLRESKANEGIVFYSYWLTGAARGIADAVRRKGEGRAFAVSRCHGFDLYHQRHRPQYIPGQERTLSLLHAIYPISQHGSDYLSRRHSGLSEKLQVARLGIIDRGVLTRSSVDGVLRVVSCSALVPVKRLDRMIAALRYLSGHIEKKRLEWIHFGGGPLRAELMEQCEGLPKDRISVEFRGHVATEELFMHYNQCMVDVFVNTSESEGIPVTLMEAISCGIPVIGPNVGGVPEIVSDNHGCLLSAAPDAPEIGMAIMRVAQEGELLGYRRAARKYWEEHFYSTDNHRRFALSLRALIKAEKRTDGLSPVH